MKKAFFVILTLLILAPSIQAQDSKTTVKVNVFADEKYKNQIESFVSRELRSLGMLLLLTMTRHGNSLFIYMK